MFLEIIWNNNVNTINIFITYFLKNQINVFIFLHVFILYVNFYFTFCFLSSLGNETLNVEVSKSIVDQKKVRILKQNDIV